MSDLSILIGDSRKLARELPAESVQCVVTSPPYWGLRSYLKKEDPNKALEIGQEKTPQEYVETLVNLFRDIRRALKKDGTVWLNLGDSYARNGGMQDGVNRELMHMAGVQSRMLKVPENSGLKPKDLIGIPWRVALALQADGWWLRSDIVWAKPNCMPESVTDRPTRSHEYIFLLSKSQNYFYDHEAIKEPAVEENWESRKERATMENKLFPNAERNGIRPAKAMREGEDQMPASWRGSAFHDGKNLVNHPNVGKQRSYERRDKKSLNDNYSAALCRDAATSLKPDALDADGTHHGQNARRKESGSFSNDMNQRPAGATRNKRDVWRASEPALRLWLAENHPELLADFDAQARNKKDVFLIPPAQFREAHFAVFPEELIQPCILAGSRPGDTVLDPFGGSGTTGRVALSLGRRAILMDLNGEYRSMMEGRTMVTPGLAM